MRKKYPHRNLVYLGSHCFKMFGITNALYGIWNWEGDPFLVHKDKLMFVTEELPQGCENHPEKKYWKLY